MNPIRKVALGNTYQTKVAQQFLSTRYDHQDCSAVSGVKRFFVDPISGTKPETDTNMTDPGQMPQGVNFTMTRLGLRIVNTNAAQASGEWLHDLIRVISKSILTFKVIGKQDIGQWPLDEWMPSITMAPTAATSAAVVAGLSAPVWKDFSAKPITLSSQVRFELDFNFGEALPADTRIGLLMYGIEIRKY